MHSSSIWFSLANVTMGCAQSPLIDWFIPRLNQGKEHAGTGMCLHMHHILAFVHFLPDTCSSKRWAKAAVFSMAYGVGRGFMATGAASGASLIQCSKSAMVLISFNTSAGLWPIKLLTTGSKALPTRGPSLTAEAPKAPDSWSLLHGFRHLDDLSETGALAALP